MFDFLTQSRKQLTLVFQIAEGVVEAALLQEQQGAYTVLFTQRVQVLQKQHTRKEAVEALVKALFAMPEVQQGDVALQDAAMRCVFVEPLSMQAERRVEASLKKDGKITAPLLRKALKKGAVLADTTADVPDNYAIYAEQVAEVALNGYPTNKPVGKVARRITLTLQQSLVDATVWNNTAAVLESFFNREFTYAHAAAPIDLTVYSAVEQLFTATSSADEITRVVLNV